MALIQAMALGARVAPPRTAAVARTRARADARACLGGDPRRACNWTLAASSVSLPDGGGSLRGLQQRGVNGAPDEAAWLGIPYAQPPVRELRWRPPQTPASKWRGVRNATTFAPDCAQLGPSWPSLGDAATEARSSEDCLYVNVFSPAARGPPKPVVVFFPSGAFMWGAANDLEISARPQSWHDTVLVTVGYRLSVFGFLGARELRARSPDNSTGLYGLQDQRAALQWVQRNIAAFGGNPGNVTIFGESAGATSVSAHLVMPQSWGLFHAAVMDSGAFNSWTRKPMSFAQDSFDEIVANLGCGAAAEAHVVDCMLNMSTGTLLNASDPYFSGANASNLPHPDDVAGTQWGPITEGVQLPLPPVELLREGRVAPVPVLLGTNLNEGTDFMDRNVPDLQAFEARPEQNPRPALCGAHS